MQILLYDKCQLRDNVYVKEINRLKYFNKTPNVYWSLCNRALLKDIWGIINSLSLLSINFRKCYLEYLLLPFPSFYFIGWNFINILKPEMSYCHFSYKPFSDTLWNQISYSLLCALVRNRPCQCFHSLAFMPLSKHLLLSLTSDQLNLSKMMWWNSCDCTMSYKTNVLAD